VISPSAQERNPGAWDLASPEGILDCGMRISECGFNKAWSMGHGAWSLQFKSFKSLKSSIELTAHRDKID